MKIAKIVGSNSHIDYVARVIDELDAAEPPRPEDYGFGEFVSVEIGHEKLVGVIYDSRLINPEYANFGPRLSPKPALENFTPDFINEQGLMIGIIILGTMRTGAVPKHEIPHSVIPPGRDVESMNRADVVNFHKDEKSAIRLHYYPQLIASAGRFAVPLFRSIVGKLSLDCSDAECRQMDALSRSLHWQHTFGNSQI